MKDEKYRVVIKTSFDEGTLKVGEVVVPGKSTAALVPKYVLHVP